MRYQFFTAREELMPIRHIFHTNISHFMKFAHVVKLYVAYIRNLYIDKKTPKISCILQSIPILHIYVRILAHLNRRLMGELIVYQSPRRPSVRPQFQTYSPLRPLGQ